MLKPLELSNLLSSKICHDLINPVSALNSAIDVLEDPDAEEIHEDALNLVKTSARQASSKLKFFRIAFGEGKSGSMELSEIINLVEDAFKTRRLSFEWKNLKENYEKSIAKIILNQCFLASGFLPRGGSVIISDESVTRNDIVIMGVCCGKKAKIEPIVQSILEQEKYDRSDLYSRTILAYFFVDFINSLKGHITLFNSVDEEQVKFSSCIPV